MTIVEDSQCRNNVGANEDDDDGVCSCVSFISGCYMYETNVRDKLYCKSSVVDEGVGTNCSVKNV